MTKSGVFWLREDFRLKRNEALAYATANHENVSVIYIFKKKSYEKQIKTLRALHDEEILKRDGLIDEYQKIIKQLERDFEKKNKVLEEDHKEKIKRVVIESKKNPAEVKKKIQI